MPVRSPFRPWFYLLRKLLRGEAQELGFATRIYFSQFAEDVFLDNFFAFSESGYYVEVGAYHPIHISNTFACYRRGWTGLLIEPNPVGARKLRRRRPRDICINMAVSTVPGVREFAKFEERSGLIDDHYLFDRSDKKIVLVQVDTLANILRENIVGTAIDFMSVDCEGHDLDVLASNDWNIYRPRLVLVEDHDVSGRNISDFMRSVGYVYIERLGLTSIFVDDIPTDRPLGVSD